MRAKTLQAACLGLALFLPLAGCHSDGPAANPTAQDTSLEHFTVRGRVIEVHGATVTLNHEAVPGFMDAMTMAYKLKDPGVASELHPGDRIMATILVHKGTNGFSEPMLDEIVITAQAKPDYKPAVQYHIPQPGDLVPNFALLNQSDHMLHVDQFRGKLLLTTFIYTRCTVADFCPRMSRNFAAIDAALQKDPKLYAQTHLLSISFDPAYDTPRVLRSYGGAYTGQFTKETFAHWDFAAPPAKELPQLAEWFGVGIEPGANGALTHSLSTALIGKDGRVLAWFPTNEWTPAQMLTELHKAAPDA